MTPKKFKEANVTYAKDQPEYSPLPALSMGDEKGTVIVCWNLSLRERLRILFRGEVWHTMLTFGKSLQPQFLSTKQEDHYTVNP